MAVKPKLGTSDTPLSLKCSTCNLNLGEDGLKNDRWRLKAGQAIHHCDGSTVAFGAVDRGAHHTLHPWPNCWRCHLSLGCPKCVTANALEVLCERCLVWGTREAFLHHGPIANDPNQVRKRGGRKAPEVLAYPDAWLVPFTHGEMQFETSETSSAKGVAHGTRLLDVFSAAIPERYAAAILHQWAEKQPEPG